MSNMTHDQPMTTTSIGTSALDMLLGELVNAKASDLHLKPGQPPLIRLRGGLTPLEHAPLDPASIMKMLDEVIPKHLRERLVEEQAIDFGYGVAGVSRFRASVFYQRGTQAAVFRRVPFDFPTLEDWGLPPVLNDLTTLTQGLVLITGPTGSGKSSTLASLIQRAANTRSHHIVTIEDPIEFLVTDASGSVSQREIGIDTPDFSTALRNVLRQDPDIIMVGEMRDEETIRTVLTAAETGHLVFSTLHTNDATQTVDRIISTFPDSNHRQVRQQLATCLEAVISMQLVPRADGSGMVAAVEILRRTPQVSKLLLEGDDQALYEAIENSVAYHKMQTMNQSLAALIVHGEITREDGMHISAKPEELDLLLRQLMGTANNTLGDEDMAEPTSDFSKILQLQEVKKHYDDLQARHAEEVGSRDREIAQLRSQVQQLSGQREEELGDLRRENERLTDQIKLCREEYEQKLARANANLKAMKAQAAAADPAADPKKRGFFR
jgi:twitching motility protein PilT